MEKNVFTMYHSLEKEYRAARDYIRAAATGDNSAALYNVIGECLRVREWSEKGTIAQNCTIGEDREDTIECICLHAAKICGYHSGATGFLRLRRYLPDLLQSMDYNALLELSENGFEAALAIRSAYHKYILEAYGYISDRDFERLYDKISEFIQRGIYA